MPTSPANPELVFSLRRVTESAALRGLRLDRPRRWHGRRPRRARRHARRACRCRHRCRGGIGYATKGEAPQPERGERLGRAGAAFKADIAVDPVEGTSYLARGQTNALAVLAVAPRGAMMDPGPAFYMEKFVASAPARGKIDPRWPVEKKLTGLAEALRKDVIDLTVFVLEKPRHRELVDGSWRLARGSRSIPPAMSPAR